MRKLIMDQNWERFVFFSSFLPSNLFSLASSSFRVEPICGRAIDFGISISQQSQPTWQGTWVGVACRVSSSSLGNCLGQESFIGGLVINGSNPTKIGKRENISQEASGFYKSREDLRNLETITTSLRVLQKKNLHFMFNHLSRNCACFCDWVNSSFTALRARFCLSDKDHCSSKRVSLSK